MHKLRQMLMDELKKYESRTDLSLNSLDAVYKIASTIKNIDKIEMYEREPRHHEEVKKPRTEKERLVDSLEEVMKDTAGYEREIYRKIIAMLEA